MSQPPPGYVHYAEAYPPELRYLYQARPLPRRRTWVKVLLSAALVSVVLLGVLGYVYIRPILAEYPATLSTPDSVAGMPRLIDERFQEVSDQMTATDVPGWDSVSHIDMICAVEQEFKIQMTTKEVANLKNVGELASLIARKVSI